MRIAYTTPALEDFAGLTKHAQERVAKKLLWYAAQERPLAFAERLTGYRAYRFRIGEYRVLFDIDAGTLFVLTIRRRDCAYRGLD